MIGIYKFTNTINGKSYIGQSKNISKRINEHYLYGINDCYKDIRSVLEKAINWYGYENFDVSIICLCDVKELNNKEQFYISMFDTLIPNGYNISSGGNSKNYLVGLDNPSSKLTFQQIYDIREDYKNMTTKRDSYRKYSDIININTFNDVWCGKTYINIHYDVYTAENKSKQRNNFSRINQINSNKVLDDCYILKIKNIHNEGVLSRKDAYDEINQEIKINENTFNDIWYNKTFLHIQSKIPNKRKNIKPKNYQNGERNPAAKFSNDDIIRIRKCRDSGMNIQEAYFLYGSHVTYHTFKNLWNNKTYKGIG